MRGPHERLKYDLRRLWECPNCQRRDRTEGTVTVRWCSCGGDMPATKPVAMTLKEEAGHRVTPIVIPRIDPELLAPLPTPVKIREDIPPPTASPVPAEQDTHPPVDGAA